MITERLFHWLPERNIEPSEESYYHRAPLYSSKGSIFPFPSPTGYARNEGTVSPHQERNESV